MQSSRVRQVIRARASIGDSITHLDDRSYWGTLVQPLQHIRCESQVKYQYGSGRDSTTKQQHRLNQFVDVDSLDHTLEQHRQANISSRIRKVTQGSDPGCLTIRVGKPSSLQPRTKSKRTEQKAKVRNAVKTEVGYDGVDQSFPGAFPKERHGDALLRYAWKFEAMEQARADRRKSLLNEYRPSLKLSDESDWQTRFKVLKYIRSLIDDKKLDKTKLNRFLLEYTGQVIALPADKISTAQQEPWAASRSTSFDSPIDHLNMEIAAFQEWITPSANEITARASACQKTIEIVREICKNTSTEPRPFGSFSTGLMTPASDIDINLHDTEHEYDRRVSGNPMTVRIARGKRPNSIPKISTVLMCHPSFCNVRNVPARIPLIQAVHQPSGITVQIVDTGILPRSQTRILTALEGDENLKTVYLLLKIALDRRGLLSPFNGYLSSYGLFNMILAVSKIREDLMTTMSETLPYQAKELDRLDMISPTNCLPSLWPKYRRTDYSSSPAHLLLDFLYFYQNFDSYTFGISAASGRLFRKHRDKESMILVPQGCKDPFVRHQFRLAFRPDFQPFLLMLQDVASAENDLGRKVLGWKNIQATIQAMWDDLAKVCNIDDKRDRPSVYLTADQRKSLKHEILNTTTDEREKINFVTWLNKFEKQEKAESKSSKRLAESEKRFSRSSIPMLRPLVGRVDQTMEDLRMKLELYAASLSNESEETVGSTDS